MMRQLRTLLSLLLCACMLLGSAAMAEDTAEPTAAPEAQPVLEEIADDAVIATLNGTEITWGDAKTAYNSLVSQYGNYYDMTDAENEKLFRAVAMENTITEKLLDQKAAELGLSELTEDEITELDAAAQSDWDAAIDNYMSANGLAEESTDEQKAALRADAEAYYNEAGYDPEILKTQYRHYAVLEKVQNHMLEGIAVTDEEVEKLYQSLVAADKELYENDLAAYVDYNNQVDMMSFYAAMYGSANDMDYAWYKPAGFRAVKHILLPADEELMNTYTDLQARFEEQQEHANEAAEEPEATDAAEEPEATAEPVTAEQVSAAKAAILASLADKIEEINQKIAEGADFDELIATYGVDADGNPSDPGMASEPYKTSGYEVCASSTNYVPEFVEAAMSISEVGGVSAPYLSSYGVHILKYIADVPAGPVEMTAEQREAKRGTLLANKQSERYAATIDEWITASDLNYTGVVASYDELIGEAQ